jgi:NAD(P)-dependent dehydrogenase (short-subunit alcohol dehydrogenase family)
MLKLKDKVAFVTGGGRGIGRSIALRFAAAGARVAVVSRTRKELEETAHLADKGRILPIVADVSDADSVRRAVAAAQKRLGPINILVNNAGVYLQKPFLETAAEEWANLYRINVLGAVLCTQAILPEMLRRKEGRVIVICSAASHRGYPNQSAYVASKHALLGLTKVLAEETRGTGARGQAISPGGGNTGLVAGRKDIVRAEYMDPDEVAEMALFVAGMEGIAVIDELVIRRAGAEPFR